MSIKKAIILILLLVICLVFAQKKGESGDMAPSISPNIGSPRCIPNYTKALWIMYNANWHQIPKTDWQNANPPTSIISTTKILTLSLKLFQ